MIEIVEIAPTEIVSVTEHVAWPDLANAIRDQLGVVWAAIRRGEHQVAGHNVVVYHDPSRAGVELECGVQVVAGNARTPGGRAVHVLHVGPYSELRRVGEAIDAYLREHDLRGGTLWEVYGDHDDDPAKLRTDVYRLLA